MYYIILYYIILYYSLLYIILYYFILYHIILYCIILYTLLHCILYYIISSYIILYYLSLSYILFYIILYCIILYYIILYCIILYYIVLYHIILYHIILYYIILYYSLLYIILYYIILYYIILYYIILYYIILYYIILYYIILYPLHSICETAPCVIFHEQIPGHSCELCSGGRRLSATSLDSTGLVPETEFLGGWVDGTKILPLVEFAMTMFPSLTSSTNAQPFFSNSQQLVKQVSGCPLNSTALQFLLPLSGCAHLATIKAADCGLAGERASKRGSGKTPISEYTMTSSKLHGVLREEHEFEDTVFLLDQATCLLWATCVASWLMITLWVAGLRRLTWACKS